MAAMAAPEINFPLDLPKKVPRLARDFFYSFRKNDKAEENFITLESKHGILTRMMTIAK